MTIRVNANRNSDNRLHFFRIEVDQDSIKNFIALVDRALNCWDSAPKELKDLGDMLTHDRITQDHDYVPINTKQNSDYYSPAEQVAIRDYVKIRGVDKFLLHVHEGTLYKVLNGTADLPGDPG